MQQAQAVEAGSFPIHANGTGIGPGRAPASSFARRFGLKDVCRDAIASFIGD